MRKWAAWRGASPRAGAIWVPVVFDIKFGSGISGLGVLVVVNMTAAGAVAPR